MSQMPPPSLTCGIAGRRGPADVGQQVLDVWHGLSLLLIHGGLQGGKKGGQGAAKSPPSSQLGVCTPLTHSETPRTHLLALVVLLVTEEPV